MSYLSSPMWLVMIGIGFALAIQSRFIRPEYFSHDFQLFPVAAFRRRAHDVAVLVQHGGVADPKTLGLIRALLSRRLRRAPAESSA